MNRMWRFLWEWLGWPTLWLCAWLALVPIVALGVLLVGMGHTPPMPGDKGPQ